MQTFNQALATAYFQKQISLETALARSSNQDELQEMINRGASLLNRPTAANGKGARPIQAVRAASTRHHRSIAFGETRERFGFSAGFDEAACQ